jgi:hypothetical protein
MEGARHIFEGHSPAEARTAPARPRDRAEEGFHGHPRLGGERGGGREDKVLAEEVEGPAGGGGGGDGLLSEVGEDGEDDVGRVQGAAEGRGGGEGRGGQAAHGRREGEEGVGGGLEEGIRPGLPRELVEAVDGEVKRAVEGPGERR